ncbi:MAG: hypothetical protein A2Z72_08085 [Omnitrophica bacterium RBG_13_46_9]|nr:MAG: hypothetical protein A2Z72_08085 [Omnitrophica bacterium RBG_13_46_9]
MNNPPVTAVVCVYNGKEFVESCINSLLAQTYPLTFIVVVDDGSTDGTAETLQKFCENKKIKIHRNKRNLGLSTSRNIGAGMADPEIVAYTDADSIVREDWIEELIKPFFAEEKVEIVGGRIENPGPKTYWELVAWDTEFLSRHSGYSKRYPMAIGCNMAVSRKFLLENPFDETLKYGGEDVDLCYRTLRQGRKIYYQHSAVVTHRHRNTFLALAKQRFAWGVSDSYVRFKNRLLLPLPLKTLVLAASVMSFFLSAHYGYFRIFGFIFLAAFLGRTLQLELKSDKKDFIQALVSFPGRSLIAAIHSAGHIYGLFAFFFNIRRHGEADIIL